MVYTMTVAAVAKRFSVTIPEDLFADVERARGYESRSSFVRRALERVVRDDIDRGGAAQTARPMDHGDTSSHGRSEVQHTEQQNT